MTLTTVQKIDRISVDADLLHDAIHGPATGDGSMVQTDNGEVPTYAKVANDFATDGAAAIAAYVADGNESMATMEAAATAVRASIGYAVPVPYAAGIPMTAATQTVSYAGLTYAPNQGDLPFVTSGVFEAAKFRLIQGVAVADLAAPGGGALVGWKQNGAGAIAMTMQDKERQNVDVADFGAVSGQDCSAAVQAAINYLETLGGYDVSDSGGVIEFGPGIFYVSNIVMTKAGIRWRGKGNVATLIANSSPTDPMISIYQGDPNAGTVVWGNQFESLQFRNTVTRSDGAPFLIQATHSLRMSFVNVDFVSSAITNGARGALKCDFVKTDTFESRFSHCSWWGVLGCAIEIPDGQQSDTNIFDHCTWFYCSLAGAFFLGNVSGSNNLQFVSGKVLGAQGGGYVSSGNDQYANTTAAASSNGNTITVANATNFAPNRCVVVGQNSASASYAFVKSVAGTTITLDRPIAVNAGDTIVHGTLGFVMGHTHSTKWQGVQFEALDVGVYSVGGTMHTIESSSFNSCARGVLLNNQFRYLRLAHCFPTTIGTPKNGVGWQLVTVLSVTDSGNLIVIEDCDAAGSGYIGASVQTLVVNNSGINFGMLFRDRAARVQHVGNAAAVTFNDTAFLNFNRSSTAALTRITWQTASVTQWFLDNTGTNGDLRLTMNGKAASISFSGANGIPQIGDGVWNSLPMRLGGYYLWIDSSGRLRIKNGSPSSDTDGAVVGAQS
ncbi:hypothetical protein F3J20_22510 [Paraburkholderia sp. Cy-641]|uniref:hypothetical protein n=1 Tax=Paraburkholderia sp. Cy-641 TaxID=2608337 RepID=UPI0014235402|nr:hypothetical protein [Paraburkholderia sp. Cy-641]NIF80130.1 hypothetical protein [Paraburkholderia sp. Cy-641]